MIKSIIMFVFNSPTDLIIGKPGGEPSEAVQDDAQDCGAQWLLHHAMHPSKQTLVACATAGGNHHHLTGTWVD
jgi:hypothetical protein